MRILWLFGQRQIGIWHGVGDQFFIIPSNNSLVIYDAVTGAVRQCRCLRGSRNQVLLGIAP